MDKVTQAMVANKAAALKSDVKSMGGFLNNDGGDDEDAEKRDKVESKQRQNSLRFMQERRDRERQDRLETHQKRDSEREKIRSQIRDKYKLKGSKSCEGGARNNNDAAQHAAVAEQPNKRSTSETGGGERNEKDCVIQ